MGLLLGMGQFIEETLVEEPHLSEVDAAPGARWNRAWAIDPGNFFIRHVILKVEGSFKSGLNGVRRRLSIHERSHISTEGGFCCYQNLAYRLMSLNGF
jgi:hypothetical protein